MRYFHTIAGLLPALLLLSATPALSQVQLSGRVVDGETGGPLPGVHVVAHGTTTGTATDDQGRFEIAVNALPARLDVSIIGYQTATVRVMRADTTLYISLRPQLFDLAPLVVSAGRFEERRSDTPSAIAGLTAAELEVVRPNQLFEVMRTLPGVHMTDLGNEQHNMSIRQPLSYSAVYVYLEDGIPIRPTGLFNHNALVEMNMAAVSRIEVVRGPTSSVYGPNAIGGAVNFITARPSRAPETSVALRSSNHGYVRGDFSASTTVGRLGVWAGGYLARQRDGWAEHSDFDKTSLTGRAEFAFSPTTRVSSTLSVNRLDTDTNGNLDSLNFYGRGFTSLQTFTYRKVDATRWTTRLDRAWDSRHATNVTAYLRSNAVTQLPHYRIRNERGDPSRASGEINRDAFRTYGVHTQHRAFLPFLSAHLLLGASSEFSPNSYVAHHVDVSRDAASGRYLDYTKGDSLLTNFEVDQYNLAAYAQLEVTPIERVKLVSSLRHDRIGYAFDNHLPPSAFSGAPDETSRFARLSPRLGLTLDLGHARGAYLNFSRGFLPPEVNELYRGVKVPTLRPAHFNSYEVGGWASALLGRVYLDVSAYWMNGTDEIISILQDDGSVAYGNAGETRHMGVEYLLLLTPQRGVSVRFSGTNALHEFVRFEDAGVTLDGNEMNAAPRWLAHLELLIQPRFAPGTRFGLGWEHVGPYYMDPQNTMRYAGYDLLNVRVGYAFGAFDLWMNVRNVTDALYANIAGKNRFGQQYNPGMPRSATVGVRYRWSKRDTGFREATP